MDDITTSIQTAYDSVRKQIASSLETGDSIDIKEQLEKDPDYLLRLYPDIHDELFNVHISMRDEFADLFKSNKEIKDVESESERVCNRDFQLSASQLFVRNFLSSETPYNGLVLAHGVGIGKTCSSLTVAEEMRKYMNQMGITKRILVIASPNVQNNFKRQLFDDRKLKIVNGQWNLDGCTGNTFLKTMFHSLDSGKITRDTIIKTAMRTIEKNYLFLGYVSFSNYVQRIVKRFPEDRSKQNKALKKVFSNRLIVIDEAHNLRITDDNKNKGTAIDLFRVVQVSTNLKLLLLTATPMFNSYKEIVWLLNLLNVNDNRPRIKSSDIFDKDGSFKTSRNKDGETGLEILIRKSRGYISYVRGENPYAFPFRIYPSTFNSQRSGKETSRLLNYVDTYTSNIGSLQGKIYDIITDRQSNVDYDDVEMGLGWGNLEKPLQCLNITFPNSDFDDAITRNNVIGIEREDGTPIPVDKSSVYSCLGNNGLNTTMVYNKNTRREFKYRPDVYEKHGAFFSLAKLQQYSGKIHDIIENVQRATGVVLIFSQYISSGCIPIALALEHAGFSRYGDSKNLMSDDELLREGIDIGSAGSYALITGDTVRLSTNIETEIKAATSPENKDGANIKVVVISRSASEGVDFKFFRQVHIMEPWYNMNRAEQVIGRAVRVCSHSLLPFSQRNVEIYMYMATDGREKQVHSSTIDELVYSHAEKKALDIGKVNRVLKQNAVDCRLTRETNALTTEKINQKVDIVLSSGVNIIDYEIGDKPFSTICDYMESCEYTCLPDVNETEIREKKKDTPYSLTFVDVNIEEVSKIIRSVFKERYSISRVELIRIINYQKVYPQMIVDAAISNVSNENIRDAYGRKGSIQQIDNYIIFKPDNISSNNAMMYERNRPIPFKRSSIKIKIKNPDAIIDDGVIETKGFVVDDMDGDFEYVSLAKFTNSHSYLFNDDISVPSTIWHKHLMNSTGSIANSSILSNIKSIDERKQTIKKSTILHFFNELPYQSRKSLLKDVLQHKKQETEVKDKEEILFVVDTLYEYIINRLSRKVPSDDTILYIMLNDDDEIKYIKESTREDGKLEIIDAEALEIDEIKRYIRTNDMMKSIVANYIGYLSRTKRDKKLVFKIKDMTLTRNTGATCKTENKEVINKRLKFYEAGEGTTYSTTFVAGLSIKRLCVEEELALRSLDIIEKNDKRWFLTREEIAESNITFVR